MTNLRNHITENHRRASRMLGFALHANSLDVWLDAKHVWCAQLTEPERATLAFSFLLSLNADQRECVCQAVFDDPDMPSVPLMSAMDEAASWADWADYNSIKACTLAGYNRMCVADQSAFLDHVTARAA